MKAKIGDGIRNRTQLNYSNTWRPFEVGYIARCVKSYLCCFGSFVRLIGPL